MPYSVDCFRQSVKSYVLQNFPQTDTRILDIGAGAGAYADLLGTYYPCLDACEIWQPYISRFKLKQKYRHVYHRDIVTYKPSYYDLMILGDVLEHLTVANARRVLARLSTRCRELLVIVPFECAQGEAFGNPYEVHQQADLTLRTMAQRYGTYLQLIDWSRQDCYQGYKMAAYQKRNTGWRGLLAATRCRLFRTKNKIQKRFLLE